MTSDSSTNRPAIVVIGASAGGLKALSSLVAAVDKAQLPTLIIVQHLEPSTPSHLAELLSRNSRRSVVEAKSGDRIGLNKIYTAPPGQLVSVQDGCIALSKSPPGVSSVMPIDHLFHSAVKFAGSNTIGVILSGDGKDGCQGALAIKSAGGAVLVQSPDDAEFEAMPRAALSLIEADAIADAATLGEILTGLIAVTADGREGDEHDVDEDDAGRAIRLLKEKAGYDFSSYKPWTVIRRIKRRVGMSRLADFDEYYNLLESRDDERRALVIDLLIGVTQFFRDPAAWNSFRENAIDPTVDRMPDRGVIRAWVAGCATGEEAYTLAIVLRESIRRTTKSIDVRIFATDLNRTAIETARSGRYAASAVDEVPEQLVRDYFVVSDDEAVVDPAIRESVVFAVQNALSDPPFSTLDFICCRNLLIYFDDAAQADIVETFYFSLKPEAYLLLGTSESLERHRQLFATVDQPNRIFRRIEGDAPQRVKSRTRPGDDASHPLRRQAGAGEDAGVNAMLARYVPPAVLIDSNYRLMGVHGELDEVLTFRRGAMALNLLDMLSESLRPQVQVMLHSAEQKGSAEQSLIRFDDDAVHYQVTVEPVGSVAGVNRILVYFEKVVNEVDESAALDDLEFSGSDTEDDVAVLRRDLTALIQSSRQSREDLQRANEEVMSANEELQSSNEELESSREELKSLNEELSTINDELEAKVAELEAINDDLTNLISSTDIATLFLDTNLCIRRYSQPTAEIVNIRESDVGRPMSDLSLRVVDPKLLEEAAAVLQSLDSIGAEIKSADGTRTYLRRITPYRTQLEKIDGVVISYADVTRLSTAMRDLELQARRQRSITELGEQALGSEDLDALLKRTAELLKEGLQAEFVELQRYDHSDERFTLVAGAGWPRGIVGQTRTPGGSELQAGFVLQHRGPMIVRDFQKEHRVGRSQLLEDADVRSGISVAIGPPINPWGLMSAWWKEPRDMNADAANFVVAVANLFWLAMSQADNKRAREGERQELKALIDALPIMIGLLGEDLHFELANKAIEATGFTAEEAVGEHLSDVFGQSAVEIASRMAASPTSGGRFGKEIDIRLPAGSEKTYLLYGVPRDLSGESGGLFVAALDIDDRKRSEDRNRIISAELDHRVRNILALVATIARMTARHSDDLPNFTEAFGERVESLSRTHASLSERNWTGVDLEQLVELELRAYMRDSYTVSGPTITLSMTGSEYLAMAIHELTTNAVKYGAFSQPDGHVSVTWTPGSDGLSIRWRETGVSGLPKPTRQGFGSKMLEIAIEKQLGGELEVVYGPEGIECNMLLPNTLVKS